MKVDEQQAKELLDKVRKTSATLGAAKAARDTAILEAMEAGVQRTQIAEAAGLERSYIYKLRNGTR